MLSDKPKLVFTDIAGRVTLESKLLVSLSQKDETLVRVFDENRTSYQQIKQAEKPTPMQQYLSALYNVGEALK